MGHIKIAISVTCKNQNIQSHIEKTLQNALHSVEFVDLVKDDSWDYSLQYTVIEKMDAFVEIQAKCYGNRRVKDRTSDSTDIMIDCMNLGVFQIPVEELSEFCKQHVQTLAKWERRWGWPSGILKLNNE